jgi:hypothetical protein
MRRAIQTCFANSRTLELGVIQGNPQFTNLGDPAAAGLTLGKAQSLIEQLTRAEPNNADTLLIASRCYGALADLHLSRGERPKGW